MRVKFGSQRKIYLLYKSPIMGLTHVSLKINLQVSYGKIERGYIEMQTFIFREHDGLDKL